MSYWLSSATLIERCTSGNIPAGLQILLEQRRALEQRRKFDQRRVFEQLYRWNRLSVSV